MAGQLGNIFISGQHEDCILSTALFWPSWEVARVIASHKVAAVQLAATAGSSMARSCITAFELFGGKVMQFGLVGEPLSVASDYTISFADQWGLEGSL